MTDLFAKYRARRITFLTSIENPATISHVRGENNYSWIHYGDNHPAQLVCRTLKELERRLPGFLRISKQHLVNPAFIHHLLVGLPPAEKEVVLTTGARMRLSRRRSKPLRQELAAYPRWPKPANPLS